MIEINVDGGEDLSEAKIHFDAHSHTTGGGFIISPYSHDSTFVFPEPATSMKKCIKAGLFYLFLILIMLLAKVFAISKIVMILI